MKIKLGVLFIAQPVFDKLFNASFSGKLAYRLSKISKVVNGVVNDINIQRNKLIEKYADPQTAEEKEKNIHRVGKKMKKFADEFAELLQEEEEVNIALIPLGLLADVNLSANEINAIEQFLEPEEVAPPSAPTPAPKSPVNPKPDLPKKGVGNAKV